MATECMSLTLFAKIKVPRKFPNLQYGMADLLTFENTLNALDTLRPDSSALLS